jgi:hypothetical protein
MHTLKAESFDINFFPIIGLFNSINHLMGIWDNFYEKAKSFFTGEDEEGTSDNAEKAKVKRNTNTNFSNNIN